MKEDAPVFVPQHLRDANGLKRTVGQLLNQQENPPIYQYQISGLNVLSNFNVIMFPSLYSLQASIPNYMYTIQQLLCTSLCTIQSSHTVNSCQNPKTMHPSYIYPACLPRPPSKKKKRLRGGWEDVCGSQV